MSDNDNTATLESPDHVAGSGSITESITISFTADMTPSQMAKKLRQVANILHAFIANLTRYAAIGDGVNAGAGAPVIQQVFTATANTDAAAKALEQAGSRIMTGTPQIPTPNIMGRA